MSAANPRRNDRCILSREDSLRVDAYAVRVGWRVARRELGVGKETLDAARDQGRMQIVTRDRLLDALARVEAA